MGWDDTMEAVGDCSPLVKFPYILPNAVKLNPILVNTIRPQLARFCFSDLQVDLSYSQELGVDAYRLEYL